MPSFYMSPDYCTLGSQRPSVSRVLQNGYVVSSQSDPALAMLSDRADTSWMALDDVIEQVRSRYDLYSHNTAEIEHERLMATTAAWNWHRPPGWVPELDVEVQQVLQGLDAQRRQERVSLWRDVSRLRSSLPEAAREYLDAWRKTEMLKDAGGDWP